MVIRWDLNDPTKGTMVAKVPTSIYAIHYSVSDSILFVGQNYEGIHLLDLGRKEEKGSIKVTDKAIFDIKADESAIFVATAEGEIVVIDRSSLTIMERLKFSDQSVRTLRIVGDKIVAGYSDAKIRVFSREKLNLIHEISAHKISVFAVLEDPAGKYLLSGSRDAHLKVWGLENFEPVDDIPAHMYAINHIAFSPDGQHFVTCSMDKSIKIWDSETFRLKKVIDKARHAGHGTSVNKLLWTNHHNYLISCSDDRSISVWNIKFGE